MMWDNGDGAGRVVVRVELTQCWNAARGLEQEDGRDLECLINAVPGGQEAQPGDHGLPMSAPHLQYFTMLHCNSSWSAKWALVTHGTWLGGKCPSRSRQKLLVLGLDGIVYVHVFLMIFQVSPSFHTWAIFPGLLAEQESLPTYAEANAEGTGHLKAEAVPNGGASCRSWNILKAHAESMNKCHSRRFFGSFAVHVCFLPTVFLFSWFRTQEHLDRKKRELQQKRAESEQARLQKLSDQFSRCA